MSRFIRARKALSITSICFLSAIPVGSFAVTTWTSSSGTVSAVYSHNGFHFVQTSIPDAPCGAAGRFWWPISGNDNAKDMFALALAAHLAGKRINVAHDAAAPNCSNNGNLATYMVISD